MVTTIRGMHVAADITHGHVLLADWLLLIAAVLFVFAAVLYELGKLPPRAPVVACIGLACTAVALLVL